MQKYFVQKKNNLEEWEEKNPNGYGGYDFSDGTSYKVEWKDGEYNGQGIFSDSTGDDNYKGKWKNGKMHGQGIRTYYDGVPYVESLQKWGRKYPNIKVSIYIGKKYLNSP